MPRPSPRPHRARAGDLLPGAPEAFVRWVQRELARALTTGGSRTAPTSITATDVTAGGATPSVTLAAPATTGEAADPVRARLRRLEQPWLLGVDVRERPPGCLRWSTTDRAYRPCTDDASAWHRHATWYAEARSRTAAAVLGGHAFAELDGDDVLLALRPVAVDDLGPVSRCRLALRGHPARRAHRLR